MIQLLSCPSRSLALLMCPLSLQQCLLLRLHPVLALVPPLQPHPLLKLVTVRNGVRQNCDKNNLKEAEKIQVKEEFPGGVTHSQIKKIFFEKVRLFRVGIKNLGAG